MLSAIFAVAMLLPVAQSQPMPRIDRLERLAELMDRVPPDRFDIHIWGSQFVGPEDPYYQGCAGGWATLIFKSEGLTVSPGNHGMPSYRGLMGIEATREFFGLDEESNLYLFTAAGDANRDPRREARNIRAIIQKHRKTVVANLPANVLAS